MAEGIEPIIRGTSPTIEMDIDASLDGFTAWLSVGREGKPFFTVEAYETEEVEEGAVARFRPSQSDTLKCKSGATFMQMRAVRLVGEVEESISTEFIEVVILPAIEPKALVDND